MGKFTTYTAWLPSASAQSYLILGLTNTIISTDTIQNIETRAEGMLDLILGKRYALPMTSACRALRTIAEDIVTYDIYNLLLNSDGGMQKNEMIEDRYTKAFNLLELIQSKKVDLYDDSGTIIQESFQANRYYSNTKNYTPTFNVDSEINWNISPSRLDDIDTERDADT